MKVDIPQPKPYPIVNNLFDFDVDAPVQSMMALAKQYDGIFKLKIVSNEVIIISDPDLVNEICDESRFDKKVHAPLEKIRDIGGDGLFTAYTQEPNWEKAHRILVPAFGPSAIKDMFPEMLGIATQMVQKWEHLGENVDINVVDDFTRLTLDTIALCAFDYRFNSFYKEKMHPFVDAMVGALKESNLYIARLPIQNKLMFLTRRNFERETAYLKEVALEIINDRKKIPSEDWPNDLLSLMLKGKDPVTDEGLSDENIMHQMITFLIAGHETTSGMLSFAFYLLLKNPEKLLKAQALVDEVLGDEIPRFEHLSKLTYLDQILKESLRLWPTAPAFGVTPYEDTTLIGGKYEVKKGDNLLVLLPSLHRSSKIWKGNVEAFIPERFDSKEFNKLPLNVFKPFGNGQRSCIGRPFAMQEAILVMALILQRFDLVLTKSDYELKIKETLTMKPDGFYFKAKKRKNKNLKHNSFAQTKEPKKENQIIQKSSHNTPLLVLFGSNSGSAQDFAHRITTDAARQGYDAKMGSLDSFTANLPTKGLVIIVAASYEGQPTDNARKFVSWLKTAKENSLSGVQYMVFGCGNRDWASTYQAVPIYIDNQLNALGATRLLPRGEADAKNDFFGDFDRWHEPLWTSLARIFNLEVQTTTIGNQYNIEVITDNRINILKETTMQEGVILENYELVNMAAPNARSKRHIEIALPEGLSYQTGDYLAVLPTNSKEKVEKLLARFQLDYNTQIIIKSNIQNSSLPIGYPVAAGDVLSNYVELNQVMTQKQVGILLSFTQCPPEKRRLEQYVTDEFYKKEILAKRVSIADALQMFPACEIPFNVFLEMLPPMKPRQYSISSSPLWNDKHCTLTLAVIDAPALSGVGRYTGTSSNYLANAQVGSKLTLTIKKSNTAFHLPQDTTTPIIMIGAGTGLAPFRGFIQERAIQKANGKTVGEAILFFGCDAPEVDFLYKKELQEFEKQNVVNIKPAFSVTKENGIEFVQHRVWQDKEDIIRLLKAGAKIYVCGDGRYMAPAVRSTLIKIYQDYSQVDDNEAEMWMNELEKKDQRYVADIF